MSMAHQRLESPSHYTVHPPTPPCLPIGYSHGHEWSTHTPFHVNDPPPNTHTHLLPFLKWGYFKLWPWNYKIKVMGVVKRQDHTVSPVSNWFAFFLFHINQITIPEIQLFWNLTSKNQSQGHAWGQRSRSQGSPSIQPMHLLFVSHQSDQPSLRYV